MSFGILPAMIIDGSTCRLMSDDDANQRLVDTNGPATSVQSISRSVGQKVYFLSWPVGGFGVSNDDRMISTADP